VGYKWCHFFQSACDAFESANIEFVKNAFEERPEFISEINILCKGCIYVGMPGSTSPQIFKKIDNKICCLGGYDDLQRLGVNNLPDWPRSIDF
jgi:hypothetical protein